MTPSALALGVFAGDFFLGVGVLAFLARLPVDELSVERAGDRGGAWSEGVGEDDASRLTTITDNLRGQEVQVDEKNRLVDENISSALPARYSSYLNTRRSDVVMHVVQSSVPTPNPPCVSLES